MCEMWCCSTRQHDDHVDIGGRHQASLSPLCPYGTSVVQFTLRHQRYHLRDVSRKARLVVDNGGGMCKAGFLLVVIDTVCQ